jgi:purine-nucleoside phosphorylase
MSTVLEAIAARQMGIEVLGVSCITNTAAGVPSRALEHAEVLSVAGRSQDQLFVLVEQMIGRL